MVQALDYQTVTSVISSWDACKRHPNYDENRMEALALEKLFQLEPRTKVVFGLSKNTEVDLAFITSGKMKYKLGIIRMLDGALSMLGPDIDTLSEILDDLGRRHIKYGVKAQYYPFMGQAIFHALAETMGDDWNEELHDAWVEVYDQLCADIMKSTLNNSVM